MGVSECIIMGVPIPIGTGIFKLIHQPHANAIANGSSGNSGSSASASGSGSAIAHGSSSSGGGGKGGKGYQSLLLQRRQRLLETI